VRALHAARDRFTFSAPTRFDIAVTKLVCVACRCADVPLGFPPFLLTFYPGCRGPHFAIDEASPHARHDRADNP
jgi:hypothetical protein